MQKTFIKFVVITVFFCGSIFAEETSLSEPTSDAKVEQGQMAPTLSVEGKFAPVITKDSTVSLNFTISAAGSVALAKGPQCQDFILPPQNYSAGTFELKALGQRFASGSTQFHFCYLNEAGVVLQNRIFSLHRDDTPPEIQLIPKPGAYFNSQQIRVQCNDDYKCASLQVTTSGSVAQKKIGSEIHLQLEQETNGPLELQIIAVDLAHNQASKRVGYQFGPAHEISAAAGIMRTSGRLANAIPMGFHFNLAYQKPSYRIPFIRLARQFTRYVPNLRTEVNLTTFSHDSINSLNAFSWQVGPVWHYRPIRRSTGKLFAAVLPGVSLLLIERDLVQAVSFTFSAAAAIGYEYRIGNFKPFVSLRGQFFADSAVSYFGLGGSVGTSYAF